MRGVAGLAGLFFGIFLAAAWFTLPCGRGQAGAPAAAQRRGRTSATPTDHRKRGRILSCWLMRVAWLSPAWLAECPANTHPALAGEPDPRRPGFLPRQGHAVRARVVGSACRNRRTRAGERHCGPAGTQCRPTEGHGTALAAREMHGPRRNTGQRTPARMSPPWICHHRTGTMPFSPTQSTTESDDMRAAVSASESRAYRK
jgi:hypothetical protein